MSLHFRIDSFVIVNGLVRISSRLNEEFSRILVNLRFLGIFARQVLVLLIDRFVIESLRIILVLRFVIIVCDPDPTRLSNMLLFVIAVRI
jgi:hypothetical protein